MIQPQANKEKIFRRFRAGEARALTELLELERPELFDYLLRMTGQVSKATDTVDEVFQSMTDHSLESTAAYLDFRVLLFATARSFTTDVWNAPTARLINAALEVKTPPLPAKGEHERQHYRLLDKALRSLPGVDREVLLLHSRAGFDWAEIAQIMGVSASAAEQSFAQAASRLSSDCPGVIDPVFNLTKVPAHPEPERSSQRTVNLSMVMQGITARPAGLWSPLRLVVLVTLLLLAILLFIQPELVDRLVAAVHELTF